MRDNPKVYRAAFVEAPGAPLLDHPQARVRLHPKVGQAQDELRARRDALVKSGWEITAGTLGKSVLVLGKSGETLVIGVDKQKRVPRGGGNQKSLSL